LFYKVWSFFLHFVKDIEKVDRLFTCFYIFDIILSKISVNNAWFYSFHGCLSEESIVGGEYLVNASVEFDTSAAEKDDSLERTVDYVAVYNAIKKEMDTPSKLLEVVVERIIFSINKLDKKIITVDVSIKKINPPVGGCVDSVELRKKV
tara:strand:- start:27 stop:473 length:447 start_codon:yes stop_codon:yes gene_type:complete